MDQAAVKKNDEEYVGRGKNRDSHRDEREMNAARGRRNECGMEGLTPETSWSMEVNQKRWKAS